MLNKIFAAIFVLLCAINLCAQKNNIWYFGDRAGISFNANGSLAIPYALTNSAMQSNEGCASVCDAAGSLLFYTSGEDVYNHNHQVMDNGDGLLGFTSSFQSALIVQQPNSDSLYYVFTTDGFEKHFANGYNYSVVDISRNNGLGKVITKNIPLYAPSTERLTAARHANGIDVWIITNVNNSDTFKVWLLTCNGLQPDAVVSTAGEVMNEYDAMNSGGFKVSPDGKLLCQTHFPTIETDDPTYFQLFDFDNATGVISNARRIETPNTRYFGSEFSLDSKLLYVTRARDSLLDQFDVTQLDAASIIASRIAIPAGYGLYAIQTGPDKKIYLNRGIKALSVINYPNARGAACGVQMDKIDLANRNGGLGLPGVINDVYASLLTDFTYTILDSCAGKVQFTATDNIPGNKEWIWDFGDGTSSNLQNPLHYFQPPGKNYNVLLRIQPENICGFYETGKQVNPAGISVAADYSFVAQCDSGIVRFTNESVVTEGLPIVWYWDLGDNSSSNDLNPVHVYNPVQNYNVLLKILTGKPCLDDSVRQIVPMQKLNIVAHPDTSVAVGDAVQLYITGGGQSFQWSPATWLSSTNISNPVASPFDDITYTVTATNEYGCTSVDSVAIKVLTYPDVVVPAAFTPNYDGKNDVLRPFLSTSYTLLEFSIINRWGKKIFTTAEKGKGWDGSLSNNGQDLGTYIWLVRAADKDGKVIIRKGTVVLLR